MTTMAPKAESENDLATPRGPKQEPSAQCLFRNVPSAYVVNRVLTKEAFMLRSRDRGLLSVALESKTTARSAYELRFQRSQKHSAGIWAVSVDECVTIRLDAYSDPEGPPLDDPAHGCIDFRALVADKKERMAREKELLHFAIVRGVVYEPGMPER